MENEKSGTHKYTNRLINNKSPYLLQHAHNPVEWFPWSDEAFEKARAEDKPLLVSIGYATCHWCHVMAHESFEDEEVAQMMNKEYVAIKVDREERPDVDNVYMMACQALTGRGGWPLNVFITPDGKPFYAGSYFPKNTRMGLPGFMEVLAYLANVWKTDRGRLLKGSEEIASALQPRAGAAGETVLDEGVLKKGNEHLARSFDTRWGGFGEAPKFPSPHQLTFLLRWFKRSGEKFSKEMVAKTLNAMRDGGIFDQVGYGFHRYSVDAQWLVPHFEKMLYDQALLVMAYAEAYQLLGDDRFAQTVREVSEYVVRDMTGPEGGFYSAEDADSEGREGLFYVWKPEEIVQHLGKEWGDIFCKYYDIRPGGNFEDGYSIPHVHMNLEQFASRHALDPAELKEKLEWGRRTLFAIREKRVHPLKDDKILTSWNGLMIAALAKASQALGDPSYAEAAGKAAEFVIKTLRKPDGTFFRRFRHGEVAYPAYLDDYAFFAWGLIELYETVFDVRYLEYALSVTETMIDLFWDKDEGGFFFSGTGNEQLYTRSKEVYDGALPSGNSVAALNLLRLGRMTGRTELEERADRMFRMFGSSVAHLPKVYTQFLNAVDFAVGPGKEIVIAGDSDAEAAKAMVQEIHKAFLPNTVLLKKSGAGDDSLNELAPFVTDMTAIDGEPAAYVCEQYACRQPVTKIDGLKAALA